MLNPRLSTHGNALLKFYEEMASTGYMRVDGVKVENAYDDFELRKFRKIVLPQFEEMGIKSVLDYGAGGSDWAAAGFDQETGLSAQEYFKVENVKIFEPARHLLKKEPAECVVCFDVLEHVFLTDIPTVVRELFSLTKKLLVVNVACYEAAAVLPNGENAHVTVRNPEWWKGVFDVIALDYPLIEVMLICSETYEAGVVYETYKSDQWTKSECYSTTAPASHFGLKHNAVDNISLSQKQIFEAVDLLTKEAPETIPSLASVIANNIASGQ